VIGGDRAGEVTGGDEESDGRARVASRRAMREKERECAADGWGRPVSGGGCAGGCTGNGPRGLGRIRPNRGERFSFFFFFFYFYFFYLLFLLNKYLAIYP
jgi:hypothetical protein